MSMHLKKKMTKKSLFRRCKNTIKRIQISEKQTLINSTFRPQMTNLENITGMEFLTDPYIFRRENRQALDNNNK